MEGLIEIKNLADIEHEIHTEISMVFVDAYYNDLKSISDDREKLVRIFKNAFIPEAFYVALMDGHVAGILACSTNQTRAISLDKADLVANIGFLKGNLVYLMMEKEFHTPINYPDDTVYIESVATLSRARGKGVATKLLEHVIKKLPYREYRLSVKDNNKDALSIYEKHGFKEISRMKAGFFERRYTNYTHKLYMKYEK